MKIKDYVKRFGVVFFMSLGLIALGAKSSFCSLSSKAASAYFQEIIKSLNTQEQKVVNIMQALQEAGINRDSIRSYWQDRQKALKALEDIERKMSQYNALLAKPTFQWSQSDKKKSIEGLFTGSKEKLSRKIDGMQKILDSVKHNFSAVISRDDEEAGELGTVTITNENLPPNFKVDAMQALFSQARAIIEALQAGAQQFYSK